MNFFLNMKNYPMSLISLSTWLNLSQGDHSVTLLILALFSRSTPSWLKVGGGVAVGWWTMCVSPWSKSFFYNFLGDSHSTKSLLGQGLGLGLGPGLDNKL